MFCYVWIFHQQVSQKVRNWNHRLSIQWMNNGWTIGTRNVNVLGLLNWPPFKAPQSWRKSDFLQHAPFGSSIESSKDTWNQTQLDCFGRQSTTRTHHPFQLNQILGNQTFMNLLFSLQYTWFSDHFQDCYHIILSCWQVFHDYSHIIKSIFPDHSQHDFHYRDFHDSFILFTYHFHAYFH